MKTLNISNTYLSKLQEDIMKELIKVIQQGEIVSILIQKVKDDWCATINYTTY